MKIPFAAYLPDLPDLDNPGSSHVRNVIPARGSYRPFPGLSVYSGALGARCQGAVAVTDGSGNVRVFAGDVSKLYLLGSGSTAWEDVSGATYTTGAEERWSFTTYMNRVIASNYADAIQSYVIGTSTDFADLSADAPKCRYLTQAKNFVFAINTSDATDGAQPQRIWWCAQGDPTSWPTPGSSAAIANQSDYQDLTGDGGWNMGGVGGLGGADIVIWQERAMWRGIYVGGDIFWQFDQMEGGRGTSASGSIIQVGGLAYYLGEDGFYVTDGASSRPIGAEKIDKTFFADLNQSYFYRISGAADPINKIVLWAYPSLDSDSGDCDRILAYHWESDRWALIDGVACEMIFRSLSFGYTLETLDSVSSSLDDLTFSLDSRAWTGGRLVLSAFDTDHKLNYFSGANLEAVIDTTEAEPVPGHVSQITEVWPLVQGTSVSPTITPITRGRQNDAVSIGAESAQNDTGFCPVRCNARYHRYRVTIPAGSEWAHAIGVDVPVDRVKKTARR